MSNVAWLWPCEEMTWRLCFFNYLIFKIQIFNFFKILVVSDLNCGTENHQTQTSAGESDTFTPPQPLHQLFSRFGDRLKTIGRALSWSLWCHVGSASSAIFWFLSWFWHRRRSDEAVFVASLKEYSAAARVNIQMSLRPDRFPSFSPAPLLLLQPCSLQLSSNFCAVTSFKLFFWRLLQWE